MIVSSEALRNALQSGKRATNTVRESGSQVFLYSPKENILAVVFASEKVVYAERIKVDGRIGMVTFSPDILMKILAKRDEELTVKQDGSNLLLKSKKLSGEVALLEDNSGLDIKSMVFKKPSGQKTVDISPLINAPAQIKKAFTSIKDNISDSMLSTTAMWTGKVLKVLVSDAFHGIVLEAKLPEKVEKAKLTLPVDAFLVALEIDNSQVFTDESTCVVMSKSKYLKVHLKETTNTNVTFDKVSSLLESKVQSRFQLNSGNLRDCVASCISVADRSSGLKLSSKGNILSVTMEGPGGKISEKMKLTEKPKKDLSAVQLNVRNFLDVLHCLGDNIEMCMIDGRAFTFEWSAEGVSAKGMCALSGDE